MPGTHRAIPEGSSTRAEATATAGRGFLVGLSRRVGQSADPPQAGEEAKGNGASEAATRLGSLPIRYLGAFHGSAWAGFDLGLVPVGD